MDSSSSKKGGAGVRGTRPGSARVRGLRRWLARAQGLGQGLEVRELVAELHVRRGLALREVARVLGVSVEVVREHCPGKGAAGAMRAPKTEADFAGLREHIGVALWETVVASFAVPVESEARRPPMMAVRIKALKQIAKLYGVGRKRK